MKSSTMWSHYSMIRALMNIRLNIDISKYLKLSAFWKKKKGKGYRPKKSSVFTRDQVNKFLAEAPDRQYLATKVILIFGLSGALRCDELVNMKMENIEDHGALLHVKIPDSKTRKSRSFTIVVKLYRKYVALRPAGYNENLNVFLNFSRLLIFTTFF